MTSIIVAAGGRPRDRTSTPPSVSVVPDPPVPSDPSTYRALALLKSEKNDRHVRGTVWDPEPVIPATGDGTEARVRFPADIPLPPTPTRVDAGAATFPPCRRGKAKGLDIPANLNESFMENFIVLNIINFANREEVSSDVREVSSPLNLFGIIWYRFQFR